MNFLLQSCLWKPPKPFSSIKTVSESHYFFYHPNISVVIDLTLRTTLKSLSGGCLNMIPVSIPSTFQLLKFLSFPITKQNFLERLKVIHFVCLACGNFMTTHWPTFFFHNYFQLTFFLSMLILTYLFGLLFGGKALSCVRTHTLTFGFSFLYNWTFRTPALFKSRSIKTVA